MKNNGGERALKWIWLNKRKLNITFKTEVEWGGWGKRERTLSFVNEQKCFVVSDPHNFLQLCNFITEGAKREWQITVRNIFDCFNYPWASASTRRDLVKVSTAVRSGRMGKSLMAKVGRWYWSLWRVCWWDEKLKPWSGESVNWWTLWSLREIFEKLLWSQGFWIFTY